MSVLPGDGTIYFEYDATTRAPKFFLVNGGSGGTASVDETPFDPGVSQGTPLMAYDTVSEDLVVLSSTNRILNVAGSLTLTPTESSTCSNNGLVAVGTSSVTAIAANANRLKLILQNVGTTKLYVLLAASGSASATNFTFVLPAGGTAADGSSPIYIDEMWQGAVQVCGSAAGGELAANECT